ncbi:DUF397 domain-containing protein [Streptomyces sp. NPDC088812]|uniref:DUF397 domain-containing protein n=1 Tax=Streptomyces sp. NPDC088812 TaxID=3365905 RepID=UPI003804FCA1
MPDRERPTRPVVAPPRPKSTYSPDASNCVYIAGPALGRILLRESDAPDTVLTTTVSGLRALIHSLKGDQKLLT